MRYKAIPPENEYVLYADDAMLNNKQQRCDLEQIVYADDEYEAYALFFLRYPVIAQRYKRRIGSVDILSESPTGILMPKLYWSVNFYAFHVADFYPHLQLNRYHVNPQFLPEKIRSKLVGCN